MDVPMSVPIKAQKRGLNNVKTSVFASTNFQAHINGTSLGDDAENGVHK